MIDDPLDERDPRLAEALSRLHGEVEPPPRVEDRLIAALRSRGDIRGKRRAPRWLAALGVAAAAVLAFVLLGRPTATETDDAEFLLLIAEDTRYTPPVDAADARARVAEYGTWAGRLARAGHLVSAGELAPGGTDVRTDGTVPSSMTGVVSGYFLVRAGSRAQAEQLAAESPHLKYGGTVVVRAVLH